MELFPIDSGFIGLDTYTPQNSLPEGFCRQMDNLQVEAASGQNLGYLVPRPGKQGILTAALGGAVYALSSFVNTAGASKLLFTSGGRLYVMDPGAASATEITASGGGSMSLNSATTRFCQVATRIFIVDGVGPLKWTDLTIGRTYTGLNQPGAITSVSPTQAAVFSNLGAMTWTEGSFSTAELVTRPNCDTGGADGWTLGGASSGSASQNGDTGVWIDQLGDNATSVAINTPALSTDATAFPTLFKLTFEICGGTSNPSTIDDHDTTLEVYSGTGGTTLIGSKTFRDVPNGSQGQRIEHLFDFSDAPAPIKSVKIIFNQYRDRHLKGVVINHVSLTVPGQKLQLSSSSGNLQIARGTVQMVDSTLKTAGVGIETDLTAGPSLATTDRLVIPINALGITDTSALRMRLWLRQTGAPVTTRYYSNDLDFTIGGNQAYIDISTIPTAIRTTYRYLGIQVENDLPVTDNNPASPGAPVMVIGNIVTPGNLSIGGAPYEWLRVEVDASNDVAYLVDVILSDGSLPSQSFTPTKTQAQANLTLPYAYTNSAATYEFIFRRGGLGFTDGYYRLAGVFAKGAATVAYGGVAAVGTAPYYAFPANPYIGYTDDGTTRTLRDNTPDSWLEGQQVYIPGRLSPPTAATCIAEWLGRICLGVGNELYISWPVTGSAVYFSVLTDPNDPLFLSEGFHDWVGGKNGDIIQDIKPLVTRLNITKKIGNPWVMTGSDPGTWQLIEFASQDGLGMSAPKTGVVYGGSYYYLCPSGLVAFDGIRSENVSQPLTGYLNPELVGGTRLTPAAYAKAVAFVYSDYLFLAVPQAGDSDVTTAYRLNRDTNRWDAVWKQMAITSGASVPHPGQANDLYLGGLDGQIYVMSGTSDKATPAAGATAIACALKTRRTGLVPQANAGFFKEKQAQRLHVAIESGASGLTLARSIFGAKSAMAWSQGYTVPASSAIRLPMKVHPRVRGRSFEITLGWSSVDRVLLTGIGLECTIAGDNDASI